MAEWEDQANYSTRYGGTAHVELVIKVNFTSVNDLVSNLYKYVLLCVLGMCGGDSERENERKDICCRVPISELGGGGGCGRERERERERERKRERGERNPSSKQQNGLTHDLLSCSQRKRQNTKHQIREITWAMKSYLSTHTHTHTHKERERKEMRFVCERDTYPLDRRAASSTTRP